MIKEITKEIRKCPRWHKPQFMNTVKTVHKGKFMA